MQGMVVRLEIILLSGGIGTQGALVRFVTRVYEEMVLQILVSVAAFHHSAANWTNAIILSDGGKTLFEGLLGDLQISYASLQFSQVSYFA